MPSQISLHPSPTHFLGDTIFFKNIKPNFVYICGGSLTAWIDSRDYEVWRDYTRESDIWLSNGRRIYNARCIGLMEDHTFYPIYPLPIHLTHRRRN